MIAALLFALAAASGSVLDGLSLPRLEVLALDHPTIAVAEAQVDQARLGVRAEEITPVKGLSVGTGVQNSDEGLRMGAQLWLSVNVTDLILYRNRMRSARAGHREAKARRSLAERQLQLEVRRLWSELSRLEAEVAVLEESITSLEVRTRAANQMFLSGQLDLGVLSDAEAMLLTARQRRNKARGAFRKTVYEMESLIGMTLAEAREDEP